jgi:hypothetical protein
MPSNVEADPGTGGATFVTRQVSHDGDTAQLPGTFIFGISGTEDSYTISAINGDGTNGLDVDVTRVSGTVTVDNGGTFAVQVDAALPAGTNAIGKLAANSGVDIGDVDVNSVIPGTGATNLGKAIDSVAGATDTGISILAIRDDSLSALTPAEGDWAPLRVNSTGALYVTGGGGGTEYVTDDPAPATPTGTATLMERDDALGGLTPVEGDWSHMYCDANGALWVSINGSVTVASHNVTNAGTFAVQVDAALPAGTNAIGKLAANSGVDIGDVDVLSVSGQTLTFGAGAVAAGTLRTTLASDDPAVSSLATIAGDTTSLDGKVTACNTGAVVISSGTVALSDADGVDIGNVDVASIVPGTGATNLGKAEDAAHTTGDTGVMSLAVQQTADAALAGTTGDYAPLQVDETGFLKVNIKAGSSSGTEYTEDAAAPANPAGGAVSLVRQDTPAGISSTDGDIVAQRGTDFGAAFVQILDSSGNFVNSFGGSGGTSHADDAAFSIGSASSITPTGYLADEATPDSVDEGDVGVPRMTLTRKPYAVITDPTSENNAGVDVAGHLQVDIAADSVGIGGGTQYTEDAAAAADPVGNALIMVRDDVLSGQTTADGDNVAVRGTDKGEMYVKHADDVTIADGGNVISVDWNGTAPPIGAGTEAAALRVTIANDSTGLVSVDDGGGALTVDGTVTANAGTDLNTSALALENGGNLFSIASSNATLAGTVSGNELQVDVVAPLPSGTNAIGKLVANSGVDIGDVDVLTVSGQSINFGAGAVALGTPRVTLASDDTAVTHLATIAGDTTSLDGKVTACNTGAVVISSGSVTATTELTTDDLDTGAGTDTRAVVGMVLAESGGGALVGSANPMPVSGTVTANAGTDLNTSALALETGGNLATIAGAVSGSEMQVDIVAPLPAGTATIGKLAANSGVDIGDVDILSVVPGTGATNLGKAIDTAAGAIDTGIAALAVRDDALTTLTPIEGDYVPLRVNSTGALHVTGGGGGTEYTVNEAAPANPVGTASLMERDDTLSTLGEVEADWTNMRANARGALWVELDPTNSVTIDDGAGSITVDQSGTWNVDVQDLPTAGALADGTSNPSTTLIGSCLHGFNGSTWDRFRIIAHDSADSGNPLKIGGRAQEPTAAPDEVANDDRVDGLFDRVGRLAVYQGYPRWYAAINAASSGDNTILAAQGAGKKIVVTSVAIVSDGTVDIRWESGASGTALSGQIPLQAREGYSASDPYGLFETAANALLNLELSAAVNVHGHIAGIVIDD